MRARFDSQPCTRTTAGPAAPSRAGTNQAGSGPAGDGIPRDSHGRPSSSVSPGRAAGREARPAPVLEREPVGGREGDRDGCRGGRRPSGAPGRAGRHGRSVAPTMRGWSGAIPTRCSASPPGRARRRSRPPGAGSPGEHHPDLAADAAERRAATRRMAEINAAYNELRGRRAGSRRPGTRTRPRRRPGASATRRRRGCAGADQRVRPDRRRRHGRRPVTARFDTTDLLHQRNATTTPRGDGYRHHPRGVRPPQRPRGRGGAAARVRPDRAAGAAPGAARAAAAAADARGRAGPDRHLREVPRADARARSRPASRPT